MAPARDVAEQRRSPRRATTAEARMTKHLKPKSKAYVGERKHLRQYLAETTAGGDKIKWISKKCKGSFPMINHEFVRDYSCWLLDNFRKGNLELTQSAVNYYYTEAAMPPPWMGIAINRVMRAYQAARLELAIEAGQGSAAGSRIAVPEYVVIWLLELAEAGMATLEEEATNQEDTATDTEWVVLILVGWLFDLRASSMAVQVGDLYFSPHGYLVINSELVKMKDRGVKHQKQCPPPSKAAGPRHPRARLFEVVRKTLASAEKCSAIKFPELCPDPLIAAVEITAAMVIIIPDEIASLPKGKTISSHSWRKACSSGLFSIGCSYQRAIMPWGQWKSQSSCEKYVDKEYVTTNFSVGMFDWLNTSTVSVWLDEEGTAADAGPDDGGHEAAEA